MDPNHLKHDEFWVECKVRDLVGSHLTMLNTLVESIPSEDIHEVLRPIRAHEAARKKPKREIDTCAQKLVEIKQLLQDSIKEMTELELKQIKSRIIHVNSRLSRIASSPTYKNYALEYLNTGKFLLELVTNHLKDPSRLNESIDTLHNLTVTAPPEDEEEFGDSVGKNNFSDSKVFPAESVIKKTDTVSTPVAHSSRMIPSTDQLSALINSPKSSELFTLLEQINQLSKSHSANSDQRESSESDDLTTSDSFQTRKFPLRFPSRKTSLQVKPAHQNCKVRFSTDSSRMASYTESKPSTSKIMLPPPVSDVNQLSTDELLKIIQSRFEKLGNPMDNLKKPHSYISDPKITLPEYNPSVPPPQIRPCSSNNNTQLPTVPPVSNYLSPPAILNPNRPVLPVTNPTDFYPLSFNKCRPDTWNLKFSGSKKDNVPIERFLKRVERMAFRYQISQTRLVDDVSFLLEGDAKEWYWTYLEKMEIVSWEQLKMELIRRFQLRKSDDDIYIDMSSRKQDYPRESFYDFYFGILQMSLQLRIPMPDHELIRYLKANMRPGLHLALGNQLSQIHNINQLVSKCVEFEDLWTKFGYSPESMLHPPARTVNELSGSNIMLSNAEIDPCSSLEATNEVNEIRFNNAGYRPPAPRYSDYPNRNPNKSNHLPQDVICFNCNQPGHYSNTCPVPKKKPTDDNSLCSNCMCKAGNVKTESRPAIASLPQKAITSEQTEQKVETLPTH